MEFLKIDGSYGEGGGQIVRSATTLSCLTKKPIYIEKIRQNRRVPGLRPQHLIGIKLLAKICNAKVDGLAVGSTSVKFSPSDVITSTIVEDIRTAGSISLILQTLIPAVSIAKKGLRLSIKGGTDVPWSPTSNYTKFVLAEAYLRMGIKFSMKIKKRGYYPKGGGEIDLEVFPNEKLKPIFLSKRKTKSANIICSYSRHSKEKIENEVSRTKNFLEEKNYFVKSEIFNEPAFDRGCSMLIYSKDSDSIIGSDGLLNKEINFGTKISKNFIGWNLGVDDHLSDMLVIPASVQDSTSIFRINNITNHLRTNLEVTSKITGAEYEIKKLEEGYEVKITGNSQA